MLRRARHQYQRPGLAKAFSSHCPRKNSLSTNWFSQGYCPRAITRKNTKSTKWGKQAFRRKAEARKIFRGIPSCRSLPNMPLNVFQDAFFPFFPKGSFVAPPFGKGGRGDSR